MLVPEITESAYSTVLVGSAQFATVMAAGELFEFCSTVACYIAQGANPTASAGAGSMYVPANRPIVIDPAYAAGVKLAVIRAVGDGSATLTRLRRRANESTTNA